MAEPLGEPALPMAVLTLGGGVVDFRLEEAGSLLLAYREDEGLRYLDQLPITPPDRLVPEDLAVTILVNSRVTYRAYKSVQDFGPALDLSTLPATSLEASSPGEREAVAAVIASVASWPGFAASVASKVLHKNRPSLIPILDNQAIFGAYMNPAWPARRSPQDSVWQVTRIRQALDRIAFDLSRPENAATWPVLAALEPTRSRIELFVMIWWTYFRSIEPIGSAPASPKPLTALQTVPVFRRVER